MSKAHKELLEDIEELAEMMEGEITDDDYCFIFSADGNIKSIVFPDDMPFEVPENVQKIMDMCGITVTDTIH